MYANNGKRNKESTICFCAMLQESFAKPGETQRDFKSLLPNRFKMQEGALEALY